MKKFFIGLFSLTLVFVLSACEGEKVDAPVKVGEKKSEESTEQKTEFAIGEQVKIKDTILTVTKVEKSNGVEYDNPKQGEEYVIATVEIENTGKSNTAYNPFDFQMSNSQGQITETTFSTVNTDTALNSGELAPNGKVSGTLIFSQPLNDPKLQLIYKPSFWSEKSIKVNLQ